MILLRVQPFYLILRACGDQHEPILLVDSSLITTERHRLLELVRVLLEILHMVADDLLHLLSQLLTKLTQFLLLTGGLAACVLYLIIYLLKLNFELLHVLLYLQNRRLQIWIYLNFSLQHRDLFLILSNTLLELLLLLKEALQLRIVPLPGHSLLHQGKLLANHALECSIHKREHLRPRVINRELNQLLVLRIHI